MSSIGYRCWSFASIASVAAVLSGCADLEGTDQTEAIQDPIYQGWVSTDLASGNVRLEFNNGLICSGTIYSDFWVLTAAHCIITTDTNGDGEISPDEGAGQYSVTPGPNANNQAVSLSARRIYRHPQGAFGTGGDVDVAMIWLGGRGFYSSFLSGSAYSSGKLNVDTVPATSLVGMNVLGSGYGLSSYDVGVLRSAWKVVSTAWTGGYDAARVNGAGTGCHGDSGGSDRRWTGAAWLVTGVHVSSWDPDCLGLPDKTDGNVGPEAWGTWVNQKGNSCPDVTPRGRCHF